MASDASDFAAASYSIEGLPEFSFSAESTLEEREGNHHQHIVVSRDNPFLLKADATSKGIDTDDWEVSRADYHHLKCSLRTIFDRSFCYL
jgi:hypothetical protein